MAGIIGLLVVSEAIGYLFQSRQQGGLVALPGSSRATLEWKLFLRAMLEPLRYPVTVIRSSAIGTLIGAVPGVGGVVAQFYNMAYAASKEQNLYGKGSVEGLIAAEAAVDAKEGGIPLPTVDFGIPGNGEMALVLAAWMIHGLQPGPFFLDTHAHLVWALILGLFFANVIATVMTLGCCSLAARIPRLRADHVGIGVIVFSLLAMMAVRQNLWDAGLVLAIGLLGFHPAGSRHSRHRHRHRLRPRKGHGGRFLYRAAKRTRAVHRFLREPGFPGSIGGNGPDHRMDGVSKS